MKLYIENTRPINYVPKSVLILVLVGFMAQSLWHAFFTKYNIRKTALSDPPRLEFVRAIALGEEISAAKMIMLWLQAFDTQPGISIPLKELDYDRVIDWLDLILKLDSKTMYPLLAAIRFYAEVPLEEKQRRMIEYVTEKFLQAPNERWQIMAHAVYIAKHRIKDLKLAAECARLLRLYAKGENVPYWAKQMEFFVLEDMGELEAAKILIGALLESGELEDPQQRKFLGQRLTEIEELQLSEK